MSDTVLTVLPPSAEPASADPHTPTEPQQRADRDAEPRVEGEGGTGEGDKPADPPKPPKTPEQREIDRLRKSTARLTRQREEARAELHLTREQSQRNNPPANENSETLSLSRAELDRMVNEQAAKLAPTIQTQQAEIEHRRSVVAALAKEWGQEKFDSLASELDDAFGGLADRSGRPKPATDAIFQSDSPKALIEYLADPEHEDEAEAIAAMSAVQAGRAIAKLESKLDAARAAAKPKPSNAPRPLEAITGGASPAGMPDPAKNPAAWREWRNKTAKR